MSNEQNPEIVEFFASTKDTNPLTFLLRVDKHNAEKFGTTGWYPINRGIAGFGKRLEDGETVMLHRLIMNAQKGDIVKFRDEDNTNITEANMYLVKKQDKGNLVVVRRRNDGGDSGGYTDDGESGDDMNTEMHARVAPFGRQPGQRAPRKNAAHAVQPTQSSADWLPIPGQFIPVSSVITVIDHMNDDEPQNSLDIVTGFQEYNERNKRNEWYVVNVDGDDADTFRAYLQAHVNPVAAQASTALTEYKHRVQELERENTAQAQRIERLTTENNDLKKRIKDVEKLERRLKNLAVSVLDDAA